MKPGLTLSLALLLALLAAPVVAWADANPDFDDDAKPILRMQPGLLHYVESRFDVKDTGTAKYPGDDDRRAAPPYIFRARPIGSNGPFNLRLLIQPGQPGHILDVVDITKAHLTDPTHPSSGPAVASRAPIPPQPAPSSAPVEQRQQSSQPSGPVQQPAPATPPPTEPTADTPSGPIMDSGSQPSSGQPSLQPPPDPAPAGQ